MNLVSQNGEGFCSKLVEKHLLEIKLRILTLRSAFNLYLYSVYSNSSTKLILCVSVKYSKLLIIIRSWIKYYECQSNTETMFSSITILLSPLVFRSLLIKKLSSIHDYTVNFSARWCNLGTLESWTVLLSRSQVQVRILLIPILWASSYRTLL